MYQYIIFDFVAPPSPWGIALSYIVGRQVMSCTLIHLTIRVSIVVKIESAIAPDYDFDIKLKEIMCNCTYASQRMLQA